MGVQQALNGRLLFRRESDPVASYTRVIGYTRVSTEEQGDSGAGLAAQRTAIEAACAERGWVLLEVVTEIQSAAKLNRPLLHGALARLKVRDADALVVAKLDRLSRSVHDASGLFLRAAREEWALVALDTPVDTTTPMGEAFASIAAVFAQLERRLIGQRTKEALAARRAQGQRLGRPVSMDDAIRQRIVALRAEGRSLQGIADALEAARVPTAQRGRRWHASTVRGVLRSCALDAEIASPDSPSSLRTTAIP